MQPRMTSGNMNVEITEDTIRVDIIAFTHAQAEVMAEGAARKIAKDMGRTKPSEIAAIKDTILSQKKSGFKPAPEVKETLEFGRGQAVRAKAKACLVLWARFTANEEVLDERYEKARRYARYGEMPQNEDFLTLDTRLLPIDTIKYGSSPNIIWAGSDHHGKVYGYFCLYGAIGWRFVLCDGGAPPSQSICLISNPLENTTWELLKNTDSILPIDWVSEEIPAYPEDMKDIADRLRPLLRHSQEVSRDIMLFRLVEDGLRKAGCRDGDIIKPEHLSVLSRHIANALTAMVTRTEVPDEEPTT